ncbi:MAG: divergent PAP2 family protein, partial [Cyanobacteria bacterium]|nr:divergent PAP2 family protein [Cyanobacteria bacterium GSL.Bin1]
EEKLKELLGHTPLQVIVGVILGVAIALLAQSWL